MEIAGQTAARPELVALEINPQFAKALVKLGLASYELGQIEEAMDYLERSVILSSDELDVHYQLGLIYADQTRYRLAIEEFEEAQRKSGQRVDALAAMNQALEDIGMRDQTRASWQSIIEIAPESEQAKLAKAVVELKNTAVYLCCFILMDWDQDAHFAEATVF